MTISTILTIAAIIVVFIVLFKIFRWVIRLLVLVVFLILAFITNPPAGHHTLAATRKAEKEGVSMKGVQITSADYHLFSLTHAEYASGEKRVIGAGAFTQVYIFATP
jgi:hypothetical protein